MTTKTKSSIIAILFDMVGVLLFEKEGYSPNSKSQINAERIERLYNHTDDKKLLSDIKEKLKLNDKEIDEALYYIPAKYEKFTKIWELLPKLKKNYKLAVINNGNSLANYLFMDDNEENILTAKNLGMKTIWWKPSEVGNNFRLFLKLYQ